MLPFLQPKKMASVMMAKRKKDGSHEIQHEEGGHHPALMSAADDLIRAVHSKDSHGVASAMKAGHEVMNAQMPDEPQMPEGE